MKSAVQADSRDDHRVYGVSIAQVVANCDQMRNGRVKVRLTWLPGYEPWARLALLDKGTYFMPQVGDEVLVAFNHGDVREPYIVGQLWNGSDKPPAQVPGDPVNKRMIRTPKGHKIEFDDEAKSLLIVGIDNHQIAIGSSEIKITMAQDKASITLASNGDITMTAKNSTITLDANTVKITGTNVTVNGKITTKIDGGTILIG